MNKKKIDGYLARRILETSYFQSILGDNHPIRLIQTIGESLGWNVNESEEIQQNKQKENKKEQIPFEILVIILNYVQGLKKIVTTIDPLLNMNINPLFVSKVESLSKNLQIVHVNRTDSYCLWDPVRRWCYCVTNGKCIPIWSGPCEEQAKIIGTNNRIKICYHDKFNFMYIFISPLIWEVSLTDKYHYWAHINSNVIKDIMIDPMDSTHLLIAGSDFIEYTNLPFRYHSAKGNPWEYKSLEIISHQNYHFYSAKTKYNQDIIYVGGQSLSKIQLNSTTKSCDFVCSISAWNNTKMTKVINFIAVDPIDNDIVYVADNYQIFKVIFNGSMVDCEMIAGIDPSERNSIIDRSLEGCSNSVTFESITGITCVYDNEKKQCILYVSDKNRIAKIENL